MQTTTNPAAVKATYTMHFKAKKVNGKPVNECIIYSNGVWIWKNQKPTMAEAKAEAQPIFDAFRKAAKPFPHLDAKRQDNLQERLFNVTLAIQKAGKMEASSGVMLLVKRYSMDRETLAAKVEQLEKLLSAI